MVQNLLSRLELLGRCFPHNSSEEEGAALLELALFFPVFILFISGLSGLYLSFRSASLASDAARYAARSGAAFSHENQYDARCKAGWVGTKFTDTCRHLLEASTPTTIEARTALLACQHVATLDSNTPEYSISTKIVTSGSEDGFAKPRMTVTLQHTTGYENLLGLFHPNLINGSNHFFIERECTS